MKYRKKPVEIEAMQFTDESKNRVFTWASEIQMNVDPSFRDGKPVLVIPTLEGDMICSLGDYLVVEPFPTDWRKLYPCKPDIFEQTYDPVIEEDETFQKNEVYAALLEYLIEDRAQLTEKELLGEYGVSGDSPPIVTRIQGFDGSETVFWHDKQLLYDSKVIWKIESNGLLATNNGGKTWRRYGYLD